MILAAGAAIWAVLELSDCDDDDLKNQLMGFCVVDIIAAGIHAGMAYYMQKAIIKGLDGKDYAQMTAKEIQEQAGQILLYDVPVCLYSFFACGMWGVNVWGLTLDSCGGNQPHTAPALVMICWGCLAGGYLFCWYCCQCCQGTVKSVKKPGAAPQTVGAEGSAA